MAMAGVVLGLGTITQYSNAQLSSCCMLPGHNSSRLHLIWPHIIPIRCGIADPSGKAAPMGQKTKYNDSAFDKAFMCLFTQKIDKIAGKSGNIEGYDGFVEASRELMKGRSPAQQHVAIREVLLSIVPCWGPILFRKIFPPTKWSAEFMAAIAPPFSYWLVGPSEVVEVEVNGVKQRSTVHIKKCRYLESSGCVGMCVNMCKIPTQDFFKKEFAFPLTMNPNFEDMSCEMIFGQMPPPLEEDPVSKQPCYTTICPKSKMSTKFCPKVET